jgi:hypothetical protein
MSLRFLFPSIYSTGQLGSNRKELSSSGKMCTAAMGLGIGRSGRDRRMASSLLNDRLWFPDRAGDATSNGPCPRRCG